jgi:hypothetical protein
MQKQFEHIMDVKLKKIENCFNLIMTNQIRNKFFGKKKLRTKKTPTFDDCSPPAVFASPESRLELSAEILCWASLSAGDPF